MADNLLCCFCRVPLGQEHEDSCIYAVDFSGKVKVEISQCNKEIEPGRKFKYPDFKLDTASLYDHDWLGKPQYSLTAYGETPEEVQTNFAAALERLGWEPNK